ncbi:hypothetical protein B0T17DRAFT_621721 [Bombardia bombarda]|uniref:Uncharacterized protein n=1 Tax=Bombardia bombarda TaxID=252184 RepID=A0AA39W3P2_9PEZI|nr:hypothetical protein B0T17DRAFT_621721 [Bombardia bombarda]
MAFYVAPSPQYAVPVIPVATAQAVAIPAACPVVPVQYYTARAIPTSSYTTYGQQMSRCWGCYQQGGLPHCISR